jgi:hypothetical protein
MKKTIFMFAIALFTMSIATSCREEKSTGEKIEDTVDEVGDDVEDAVDDAGDAIEDATDDN